MSIHLYKDTDLTIATLVAAYVSGAKIGEDPQPVIIGRNTMPGQFYALNKYNGWASTSGQSGTCGAATGSLA